MLLYRPAQRLACVWIVAVCGVVWTAAAAAAAAPEPEALARALQRKYDTVRDFSAEFVHSYQGGVLRKTVTERGRLLVKKPGKMRWAYTGDEQKVFVSDGRKMYSYIPADKQVYVSSRAAPTTRLHARAVSRRQGPAAARLRHHRRRAPAGRTEGSAALKLVPKRGRRRLRMAALVVDEADAAAPDARGGRQAGRAIDLYVHQHEGERWPLRPRVRVQDSSRRRCGHRQRRADAMRRPARGARRVLALAVGRRRAPRGAVGRARDGGAAAGLRPRRRRVHQRPQGTARRQGRATRARSRAGFAPRRTTFNAAAGSRPPASYEEALLELQLAAN